QALPGGVEKGGGSSFRGKLPAMREAANAVPAHLGDHLLRVLSPIEIPDPHVRARSGEEEHGGTSHAARAAGDEGSSPREAERQASVHFPPSSRAWWRSTSRISPRSSFVRESISRES